jgi:hypothetical protein
MLLHTEWHPGVTVAAAGLSEYTSAVSVSKLVLLWHCCHWHSVTSQTAGCCWPGERVDHHSVPEVWTGRLPEDSPETVGLGVLTQARCIQLQNCRATGLCCSQRFVL